MTLRRARAAAALGATTGARAWPALLLGAALALGCVVQGGRPPEDDAGAEPAGGGGGAPAPEDSSGGTGGAQMGVPDAGADLRAGDAPRAGAGGSGGVAGSAGSGAGGSAAPADLGDLCGKYCACMAGGKCKGKAPADCMTTCMADGPRWALACRLEKCLTAQHDYQDQVTGDCLAAIGVNACFDD